MKSKGHPLMKGLKKHLKDPKNYKSIEDSLFKVVQTDHTHKSAKDYIKCAVCSENLEKRKRLIKSIGFASTKQYLLWKRIMNIIINKKNV